MTMNIATIISADWVETHLGRWLRKARWSNPDATLCLVLVSEDPVYLDKTHRVIGGFDRLITVPAGFATRQFYNEARMRLCGMLGVDEVLYCDADADILEDVSGVGKESDSGIMWVRSPVIRQEWSLLSQQLGYGRPDVMANNGLLYMRGNYDDKYRAACKKVKKVGTNPRVEGMMAFNVMLRDMEDGSHFQLKDEWSVIWTDYNRLVDAKIIQYCNDTGQSKRLRLEALQEAAGL